MRPRPRRGEVSVEMTAGELLSLAVNVAQNGWWHDDLSFGSAENCAAQAAWWKKRSDVIPCIDNG